MFMSALQQNCSLELRGHQCEFVFCLLKTANRQLGHRINISVLNSFSCIAVISKIWEGIQSRASLDTGTDITPV